MRTMMMAVAGAAMLLPAAAQAMDLRTFLDKTHALQAKGIFAIGSPDIDLLKTEMTNVARAYQADKAAAVRRGRPFVCAPEGAKMSQSDLLKALEAIPPARRGMSVKAAFYRVAMERWPCPRR